MSFSVSQSVSVFTASTIPQKLTMMAPAISTIRINPRILPPKGCDLANVSTKSVSLLSPNPRQIPSQRSALNNNRIMDAKNRLTTPPARGGINSRQNCFFSRSASLSRSSSSLACASLTSLLRRSMSASNCRLTPSTSSWLAYSCSRAPCCSKILLTCSL